MKNYLKEKLPTPITNTARGIKDTLKRWPDDVKAIFHPIRRNSMRGLKSFRDSKKNERCFIIGNGPSLLRTDLSKLWNEYTFGMNRIYMLFPRLGFSTTYFVSINDLVIEQTASDIQKLNMMKFVSWRARNWLEPADDLFFLHTTYTGPKFAKDITGRIWEGATVTYVALQLAFYFGFKEAILIGVDHSFATKGKPNTTVVSQGDDPNHFHPGYFGKGFRWQLPDLDTSEMAYEMARKAFVEHNRKVLDATIEGKLKIFPKVDYDSLF